MGAKKWKGKELYPHLFSPLRIGNIRMKNRIIAAPTSPSMITTEGHFTPEMIAYLEEKAKGGAGVVTYGEAIVHSATGKSHNKQLQLDSFGVKQGMAQALARSTMPERTPTSSFPTAESTADLPVLAAIRTDATWHTDRVMK